MKKIMFAVLLATPGVAFCSAPSIAGLAASLANLRDTCAAQAKADSEANALASYKDSLQDKIDQGAVQADTEVYAVGNGSKETYEHQLDLSLAAANKSAARSAKIVEQDKADSQAVHACVADAEQKGKALYSDFKRHNKHSPHSADDLMTAWLANVEEISFDNPDGSDQTAAAWKTAKAHAELSAL